MIDDLQGLLIVIIYVFPEVFDLFAVRLAAEELDILMSMEARGMAGEHRHQVTSREKPFALLKVGEASSFEVEWMMSTLTVAIVAPTMHGARIALSGELEFRLLDSAFERAPDVVTDHLLAWEMVLDVF